MREHVNRFTVCPNITLSPNTLNCVLSQCIQYIFRRVFFFPTYETTPFTRLSSSLPRKIIMLQLNKEISHSRFPSLLETSEMIFFSLLLNF